MSQSITRKSISFLALIILITAAITSLMPVWGSATRDEGSYLTVFVFDGHGNIPLADAKVAVGNTNENGTIVWQQEGLTDMNGSIRFRIRPTMLVVGIWKRGYEEMKQRVNATGGEPNYRISASLVPVQEPVKEVVVSIWPMSINGDLIRAEAEMINTETGEGYKGHAPPGEPIIITVPQGTYEIKVHAEGFEPGHMPIDLLDMETFEIKFELIPIEPHHEMVHLKFVLLSPRSDARVFDGHIKMVNHETGEVFTAETEKDNVAELKVPWGKYTIFAWAPEHGKAEGFFELFDHQEFKIEMVLAGEDQPQDGFGRIEGKVINGLSNKPLSDVVVHLKSGGKEHDAPNNVEFESKAVTNEDGFFEFEEVPCGLSFLHAFVEGFHEMPQEVHVEMDETAFVEFFLKPLEQHVEPKMVLVTGNVIGAVDGEAVPGVEVRFFRGEGMERPKPERDQQPFIVFEYIDKNSDENPEIMLLKADFNGDGRIDLHYVYIDRNSDGNPESITIRASFVPWDFHMGLPGMERYLDMMGMGWNEEEWEDEDWENEEWPDENWEDEEWEDPDDDPRRGDDKSTDDENREKEEQEKEQKEKEGKEKEQREKEEQEKEQREKEGKEKERREKEKRENKEDMPRNRDFKVVTDREGNFELKIPAGEYTVLVEAEGYLPYKENFKIFPVMDKNGPRDGDAAPETHIEIKLMSENFDPNFMVLSEEGEFVDPGSNDKAIEMEIREFMDDDSYELDMEPFREIVNSVPGEDGENGEEGEDQEGEANLDNYQVSGNGIASFVAVGITILVIIILFIFIVVAKKRKHSSEDSPDAGSQSKGEEGNEEKEHVAEVQRKVRAIRLKRKTRSVRRQ
ncbi:MAG: hypothetical protein QGH39_05000 [Candidatus Thermoplasmatota archaeon]|jgi:hypothetical protein|nr:hypothetical protein [Candidatus Thermoplasmatota archaeon]MDP7264902.1 hypothetical protein [Candidatus Thermoplasmatota archaeon]